MKKFNNGRRTLKFTVLGLAVFLLMTLLLQQSGVQADSPPFDQQAAGVTTVQQDNENQKKADNLANCRYGAAVVGKSAHVIPALGAGWFLKFGSPIWKTPLPENNAEVVHIIKTFQNKDANGTYLPTYRTNVPLDVTLAKYIKANPGHLWIIGNEVDRGPNGGDLFGGQGDMYPEIYAQAYHEVRAFVMKHDPTAQTAISGLVQVTPGRLQYLNKVWAAYLGRYGSPMPVDVWNMHVYVMPEVEPDGVTPNSLANVAVGTDPALGKRKSGNSRSQCSDSDVYCFAEHDDLAVFGEQVVAMRKWMKNHGQRQKPLILSEFSILYPYLMSNGSCFADEYGNCFTPARVSRFMDQAFAYLNNAQDENLGYGLDNNRLVQQWLWFSTYVDRGKSGSTSNLLWSDLQTLTPVGETFKQAVQGESTLVNLVVDEVSNVLVPVGDNGKAAAEISVTFRNNGNTAVDEPFTVTVYEDRARESAVGSVLISDLVRGCATNVYTAVIEWPQLTPGIYRFWVTVDGDNQIDEGPPHRKDNKGSGTVVVYPPINLISAMS